MIEVKTVAYIRCWGDVPIATKLLQLMSKAIRWALGANAGVSKRRACNQAVLKEQWVFSPNEFSIWLGCYNVLNEF